MPIKQRGTNMKLRSLLIAAFATTIAFAQPSHAEDLIVATDTAFVPFEFKEGDKYVGFDIDMWDAIAKEIARSTPNFGRACHTADEGGPFPASGN